jgi:D-glycero-D-manno-heptose 1,7-bisphosphate phosphatase
MQWISAPPGLRRAVFLDKDGTLIENVPYNADPDKVRLSDRAGEALVALSGAGFELVVVSNQSGVARGYFAEEALTGVSARLGELLAQFDVRLSGFYYCPHHPDGTITGYRTACRCRKPAPGLLMRAARELELDLSASWLVGDILDDVEAGARAGCATVLLNNGHETEWRDGPWRRPRHTALDLVQAAQIILEADRKGGAP